MVPQRLYATKSITNCYCVFLSWLDSIKCVCAHVCVCSTDANGTYQALGGFDLRVQQTARVGCYCLSNRCVCLWVNTVKHTEKHLVCVCVCVYITQLQYTPQCSKPEIHTGQERGTTHTHTHRDTQSVTVALWFTKLCDPPNPNPYLSIPYTSSPLFSHPPSLPT